VVTVQLRFPGEAGWREMASAVSSRAAQTLAAAAKALQPAVQVQISPARLPSGAVDLQV
jgi:hypothetical protein